MLKVRRDKLPKGWAYPLKASILDQAVSDAGIFTSVTLFLHHGAFWAKRPLFHANFYLVGALVKNEEEEFWIGCRSVAAADCSEARSFIEAEAIPAFTKWAAELEVLPANSTRRKSHGITRDWSATTPNE
ncbi:hypothetical protein [Sphingomonas sp. ERG5]|uniref:hypothetical protein n=1 Tax=Sphingomonas sp. ERG5 TaxID=1381597 RepID=UPI00054B8C39|nr:hypothetical protein [Sphingomonas sp. ERG5]